MNKASQFQVYKVFTYLGEFAQLGDTVHWKTLGGNIKKGVVTRLNLPICVYVDGHHGVGDHLDVKYIVRMERPVNREVNDTPFKEREVPYDQQA